MSSLAYRTGRVLVMAFLLPGLSWAQSGNSAASAPVAKQPPLAAPVNGPLVIKAGSAAHDKGDFAAAIAQYQTITPGDSTYGQALIELALSYEAAKQPEAAIAAAQKALALEEFSPHLFVTLAAAHEQLKQIDQAKAAYTEGLRRYPYAASLWYNQGVMQFQEKQTGPALVSFQRAVELRPLHAGSHLLLAYLETQQNHPSHAMLGLLTFLALEPGSERSNNALVVLENLATNSNDVWAKERIAAVSNNAPFEELDLLISSRVALRKDYKTKVKFDANLVRQTQLLVEKFPADMDATDFWGRAYGPLMKALRTDVDYLTAFTYLTLSSARDQRAAKWVESNKAKALKMAAAVRPALLQLRDQQVVAGITPETRARAWFGNDDLLDGLGDGEHMETANGEPSGEWRIINDNGALQTIGRYDADHTKTGVWKTYYDNGQLSQEATYVKGKRTGTFKEYFSNGTRSVEAVYEEDEPNGPAHLYSRCGSLRETVPYVKGKVSGVVTEVYADGKTRRTTTFVDGKKAGPEAGFFPDGTPEYTYTYAADERHGPFVVYYADKTIARKGTYDKGKLTGPYEDFHPNGKPDESGTFAQGKRTGLWKQYYSWGAISNEKTYGPDGLLNGPFKDYDLDGHLFTQVDYQQERVAKTTYYNALTGKLVAEQPVKKSGKTPAKTWYFDGLPRAEGIYRDGNMEGEWKTVARAGQPLTRKQYVGGYEEGVSETYYPTGQPQLRQTYKHGEPEGLYERFHPNGQLAQRGYYQGGQQHGIWQTFFVNGQPNDETEYVLGELNGYARTFTPTGKLVQESRYFKGWQEELTTFDSTGAVRDHQKFLPTTTEYTLTYPDGKVRERVPVLCGDATGTSTVLLPNGKTLRSIGTRGGRRHGAYQEFDPSTGKLTIKGQYANGELNGEWQWFAPDGALETRGFYRSGTLEGARVTQHPNGKPATEETLVAGERHGPVRYYNLDGELLVEKQYTHGNFVGYRGADATNTPTGELTAVPPTGATVAVKFPNGKPAMTETWRNGNLEGERLYYYSSGQVYRRCRFVNDELQGVLQTYYPSGKLLEEENFSCGERDGVCRYYRPDGTLEQTKTYRAGELAGPVTTHDAQGKIIRTDTYWAGYLYGSK